MTAFLALFFAYILHLSFSQYLPYFWNETYTLPGIYDITAQTRIYHIAYWDIFKSNDSTYQYPVIYALHGGGGQASGHARQTGLHLEANKFGYLVIYPEGMASGSNTSRTWNAGNCCGAAAAYNSNDAKFLLDILNDLEFTRNILKIDRNRVFFTGHSNGAYMSWRMGCEYPYNITAIAPNDGCPGFVDAKDCDIPCDALKPNITDITCWNESALNNDCNRHNWYSNLPSKYQCIMGSDTRTVPILAFFGYLDEHTIWNGGAGHNFLSTKENNDRPTPPVLFIANWNAMLANCDNADRNIDEIDNILYESRMNGINNDEMITYYNSSGINDSSTCIEYIGCDNRVKYCTAWNGGHTWSGGHYSLQQCDILDPEYKFVICAISKPLVGNIAKSLNNNQMMLEFFDGLSLDSTEQPTVVPSIAPTHKMTTPEQEHTSSSTQTQMESSDHATYVSLFRVVIMLILSMYYTL